MKDKNKNAVKIYDLIAEDYAKAFDGLSSDEDLRFLNKFLSHLSSGSCVLDLGCGTGFSAKYFIENGFKAEGVDLSEGMLSVARKNYPDIKFTTADMTEFDPGRNFDAVWAGYSLFHFEQGYFELTLEKIKTYLPVGGTLSLVMQKGVGEIELNEPFLPEKKIYIHLYSEEELKYILDKHGFEIIEKDIKKPMAGEFPYEKILLITKRSK